MNSNDTREPQAEDSGEPERIPMENFRSRRDKLDRLVRPGAIVVFLIWGTVLLLKCILAFKGKHHSRDSNDEPTYNLPNSSYTNDGSLKVSFANMRNGTFQPVVKSLQWISTTDSVHNDKGLFVIIANDTHLVRSVFDKRFSQVLLRGKTFTYEHTEFNVDSLVASPDLKKLLIRTNTVSNWRHSSFGTYFVYDNATSSFHLIGDNLALAEWSPNSIDIAYVQDNDVYLYSSEHSKTKKRITYDGSDLIFNGKPDWVYEEEVLEGDRALWWSPKGDYLVYYSIDETEVGEFMIPYYVQNKDDVYSKIRKLKYPKSGSPNPTVELWVYDTANDYSYSVDIHRNHGEPASSLLTEIAWVGDDKFIAKTTDRSSDLLSVVLVDTKNQKSDFVRENPSDGGWWEITHNTLHIPKNTTSGRNYDGYLDILPIDGYNHLVYFSPVNSSDPIVLTKGEWEVVDGPAAFDEQTNNVYFLATKESSTERHLYSVNLHNPGNLTSLTNTDESAVYGVSFSAGSRFALLSYRGPDVPFQKIIDLRSSKLDKNIEGNIVGKTLYYLEKNERLTDELSLYDIPQKKFQTLNLGKDEKGEDILVNSFEILPNDFDSSLRDYYPVFFYVYGGPNSQQVLQSFSLGFNEVVASQLDAIVVVVDGRGTGFKGKGFRSLVRDNLGDYEAQDQIAAAALYGSKTFVDSNKISLFGWSYGGYLTLKTLEKDAGQHFKFGLSVAPVTDWRFYDSVYTERYMHTPEENGQGYNKSAVRNATAIGQATRFLLMHGTGDDNVHFQNSLKFLDLLDLAGVENYDVHVFPDSDHSIRYHNANVIVFDKLLTWTRLAYTGAFINE